MSPRQTRRAAKLEGNNDTLSETISKTSMGETPPEKRKKTRKNVKSKTINSTLTEMIATKAPVPVTTPSTQAKKRMRRQLTQASSLESDVEISPGMNKLNTRTVQKTPSKTTRSRKKVLLDNTVIDKTPVATVTKARRTRKGKENETSIGQSVLMDGTYLNASSNNVNKSRGTTARKKTAKKTESKSSDEETVSDERINASGAKNVTIIDNFVDSTINESAVPMSIEDSEVSQVSNRISSLKAAVETFASPVFRNRRSRNVKSRLDDFTPENSPITVNLTPYRTTKTPRKSPMNLGSPRSRADALLKLSKTPRKLPVVVESLVPSEMSFTFSTHTTPEKSTKVNSPDSANWKKLHKSPRSLNKSKKSSSLSQGKGIAVRKLSKSPKIVLRSPKAKSSEDSRVSESKIKRLSSPKRSTKSSQNRCRYSVGSPCLKSPESARRTNSSVGSNKTGEPMSPRRSGTEPVKRADSADARMSVNLARLDSPSSSKEPRVSSPTLESKLSNIKSPTVILNKLSPSSPETLGIVTRASLRRSRPDDRLKRTPVQTPSVEKRSSQGGESPHRAKSTGKERTAIVDSGTPLRPIDSPVSSLSDKLAGGKSIIISSSNTPIYVARTEIGSGAVRPMLSSTPRERIRRSLNLSPSLGTPSEVVNSPMNGEVPAGSSTMIHEGRSKRRSLRIDNESNPLISEDEPVASGPLGVASRLGGTFEIENDKNTTITVENEDEKTANGTYELAEPTTPYLRRKATKRSLADIDTSIEERLVKRTCRVRFASPIPNEDKNTTIGSAFGRSRSATPRHRVGLKRTPQALTGPIISRFQASKNNAANDNSRRRSSSMTNVSLLETSMTEKRRSNSVSDVSARSASRKAQITSVNRLSKPRPSIPSAKKPVIHSLRIPEAKTPLTRKLPNFAQIHQKNFAQMESLVDAKKRVEKRHIAMSSQIPKSVARIDSKVLTKPATSAHPIAPVVAVNGSYNRYGFKLRKDDATKIIAQKQPALASRKKQNENRQLLKGVRTNRRFDLIMKARNVNF